MSRHILGSAETANGSYPSAGITVYGGRSTFVAYGTWDGATVTLEMSPDGGTTWIAIGSDTTFTADGVGNTEFGWDSQNPILVRATVSSVGTTSLTMVWYNESRG
ncbi:MAG: hypothetical protein AMJ43_07735 [Coxiella sp. DG_40]|nr:MAG: hypothetical protein AMJ43_07735 [Coxiella sp. DG_40]